MSSMAEEKLIRLGQASRKLNVGHNTILEFLAKKGFTVENNPNAKLTPEQFAMLSKEFAASASEKLEASHLSIGTKHVENVSIKSEPEVHRKKSDEEESVLIKNLGSKEIKQVPAAVKEEPKPEKIESDKPKLEGIKVLGKIELEKKKEEEPVEPVKEPVAVVPPVVVVEKPIEKKPEPVEKVEQELIKAKADKLQGLKVVDRIELPVEKKTSSQESKDDAKRKRPRKRIPTVSEGNRAGGKFPVRPEKD